MIKKTYISKLNTIFEDNTLNFGASPIGDICYGKGISRLLLYFNVDELKNLVDNKTFSDITKLKHTLKLFNCGYIDTINNNGLPVTTNTYESKERAISFDLIYFLIPQEWDEGRGSKASNDIWIKTKENISKHGSNWFQAKNGYEWKEPGVYDNTTLAIDYNKFPNNENVIIIGRQHFDYGYENLEINITETVNKFLTNDLPNYGIGIAFSPYLETTETDVQEYVGVFTNNTNTFFEPYLETIYDDYINDSRNKFYPNKLNKLYFYSNIGGEYTNLDNIPTCFINDEEYEVKQFSKGIYYTEIEIEHGKYDENTILYDTWSNLNYNGKKLPDIEMEFVLLPLDNFFTFGKEKVDFDRHIPTIVGIKDGENLNRLDKRLLKVDFRIPFTTNGKIPLDKAEYRLYVMSGDKEINVIDYQPIEMTYLNNFFIINTQDLIPNDYYIDIRIFGNLETIYHKKILKFRIINEIDGKL